MELNRRQWLKTASLAGGFTLFNGLTGIQSLSAEEIKKNNRARSAKLRIAKKN